MKIIIFDFEVFNCDALLGCYVIENGNKELFQSWNLEEIKNFYKEHQNDIWIGHNNSVYDNFILQGIIDGKNEKELKKINDDIIDRDIKMNLHIKLYSYDLILNHFSGLKAIEASVGKNISESEVDFNLDRKLTIEEKLDTESYNRDDLDQTYDDFVYLQDEFLLRLEIMREFNLDMSCISLTGTQIAERVLGAKKIYGIENKPIRPKLYDTLRLKNKEVLNFYLSERFKTSEKLEIEICGLNHTLGLGGIHGAKEKVFRKEILYLDVSGYYNLLMIILGLLSRSIPEEGKKLYEYMYHQQLKLKGIPELVMKRQSYKIILLAVWGAMKNKYCAFYDPYKGELLTISGQIFIIDLLEKLEGKIELIQSNTDGIMVVPLSDKEEVLQIVKDWCDRTGFVIKPKTIYNLVQRDVNNYLYVDDKGNVEVKGEALKHYNFKDNPFVTDSFKSKEPIIISKCIVNYFVYDKNPEETVEENKDNLLFFQFLCKKLSYDYIELEEIDPENPTEVKVSLLQKTNRVFASNDDSVHRMIYKCKKRNGKLSRARFPSLPDNIFVYNNEILSNEAKDKIIKNIDYNYYIKRAYERILEFLPDDE